MRGEIEFRDVVLLPVGKGVVLHDLSLQVAPGKPCRDRRPDRQRQVDAGESAAAVLRRERGRVLVDGHDVREYELTSLREQIALVSQDVVLFNDTIRTNIAFGATRRRRRSKRRRARRT